MRRLLTMLTLMALSGCRCLSPVQEPDASVELPDAGPMVPPDAGPTDAGSALPSDGGCSTELDCPMEGPAGLCALAARQSCIDGQCVRDCVPAGRTCRTVLGDPRCVECTRPTSLRACSNDRPAQCGVNSCTGVMEVERSTCPTLAAMAHLEGSTDPDTCLQSLLKSDGSGELVSFFAIGDHEYAARFQGLGSCVGRSAQTGAIRSLWACPGGCEFQLLGCE